MTDDEALFTTGAAAHLAKRSPESIRIYAKRGVLPSIVTTTGQRLFRKKDIEDFAQRKLRRPTVE